MMMRRYYYWYYQYSILCDVILFIIIQVFIIWNDWHCYSSLLIIQYWRENEGVLTQYWLLLIVLLLMTVIVIIENIDIGSHWYCQLFWLFIIGHYYYFEIVIVIIDDLSDDLDPSILMMSVLMIVIHCYWRSIVGIIGIIVIIVSIVNLLLMMTLLFNAAWLMLILLFDNDIQLVLMTYSLIVDDIIR